MSQSDVDRTAILGSLLLFFVSFSERHNQSELVLARSPEKTRLCCSSAHSNPF